MRRLVGATFVATQIGSLLSICALGLLPAGSTRHRFDKRLPPLRALFRNGTLIAYVAAFAGNTWEVFAVRVWFCRIPCLAAAPSRQSNRLPPLGLVSGVASLSGVPVSTAWRKSRCAENAARS
jgi:hypothetical protein